MPERGDNICFNKKLTLLTLEYPTGRGEPKATDSAEVWAEYQGVRYKISATGAAANQLHIKLSLTRG